MRYGPNPAGYDVDMPAFLGALRRAYSAFDAFQARHAALAIPLAVRQKYSEDQGSYLAAAITYYAFFSVFPLLLVLTTSLGFVLHGHPHLQQRILSSAVGQFPVIGHELKANALSGNALALALGIAGAVWAGMGAVLAVENALNQIWGVPFTRRPAALVARLRALVLLVVLGDGLIAATVVAGVSTVGGRYGTAWKIGATLVSLALDFGLFWVGLRVLTADDVSWSDLRVAAGVAAVGYACLQLLGGYYVGHVVAKASDVYGTFALVIGLLSFIYLAVHIGLLAVEGSVVVSRTLWPRSFSVIFEEPPTAGDVAALTQQGKTAERRHDEVIDVRFP
jgi:membrane protein